MDSFGQLGLFGLLALLGIVCSFVAGLVLGRMRSASSLKQQVQQQAEQHAQASATWQDQLRELGTTVATLRERATRIPELEAALDKAKAEHASLQEHANSLERESTELRTQIKAQAQQSEEKLALLRRAKEDLSNQFKSLANDILEEKSKRFTEQNTHSLGQLLTPLREHMAEFKSKVEEVHRLDTEQQAVLKTELTQLKALNQQMSAEAHSLAVALKGQAKKQGNWGELILGNVLERSGLREEMDFRREQSFQTEEGRKRPDVVVYLPEKKHLVIDAKVSLNAYTRYVNAETEDERQLALREHVRAIGDRIQELADRNYYALPGINSPEMVFMFVPIESAFVEALKADESLFQKAIEQNVLVATPTTLLTSLNIVRQLWRFEAQNIHSAELAERAAKVYKKLNIFVSTMENLGKQLDRAKETFDKSMGQLYLGKDNLIRQAHEFERLGVAVQDQLPENLVAKAALELNPPAPEALEAAEAAEVKPLPTPTAAEQKSKEAKD